MDNTGEAYVPYLPFGITTDTTLADIDEALGYLCATRTTNPDVVGTHIDRLLDLRHRLTHEGTT